MVDRSPPTSRLTPLRRAIPPRAVPLLVLAGCLLGLAIAIAGSLVILNMRARAIEETRREVDHFSLVLADQADRALQAIDLVQDSVLDSIRTARIDSAAALAARMDSIAVHDALAARIAALPQIEALTLLDSQGGAIVSSRVWPAQPAMTADRDYFRALSSASGPSRVITRPLVGRATGRWTVFLARKVTGPRGAFLGVLLAAVDLRYFERLYAMVAPGAEYGITLVSGEGFLMARYPPRPELVGQDLRASAAVRVALPDHGAVVLRAASLLDGQERLMAVRAVTDYPMRIEVSLTLKSALAPSRRHLRIQIPTLVFMELALAGVVLLGVRQIRAAAALARSEAARGAAEERARGARALARQYARFGTALDNMNQGLCMFDADQRLVVANQRLADLFAVAPAPAAGAGLAACLACVGAAGGLHAAELRRAAAAVRRLTARRQPRRLIWELARGPALAVTFAPMRDGGWLLTCEDVTEQRLAAARIDFLAHHDPLTRLANRLLFQQRLEQAVRQAARGTACAVLCVDLDRFKGVNDRLGHAAGDRLLVDVAGRLRRCVREGDTVARLGGDEFALIRAGVPREEDATRLARRIVQALSLPYDLAGQPACVGASIGIALAPAHGTDADLLLRQADMALYRAKSEGGGVACLFESEMDARAGQRHALAGDLRRAVAAAEFALVYQPQLLRTTRRVTGFEALLRWRHPTQGVVLPDSFLPLAETTGLIVPIGQWVLARACADAARWPAPLKVAVNLSAAQVSHGSLVACVGHALDQAGLAPERLELEIAEAVLLRRTSETLATLHALRDLGVAIVLDEFGAGCSSPSHLRLFPFDKVKLDRGFVQDLGHRREASAILRAMTGLCRQLGIPALIAGVETQAQLAALDGGQCAEVQGLLFGAPCPADEVMARMEQFAAGAVAAAR